MSRKVIYLFLSAFSPSHCHRHPRHFKPLCKANMTVNQSQLMGPANSQVINGVQSSPPPRLPPAALHPLRKPSRTHKRPSHVLSYLIPHAHLLRCLLPNRPFLYPSTIPLVGLGPSCSFLSLWRQLCNIRSSSNSRDRRPLCYSPPYPVLVSVVLRSCYSFELLMRRRLRLLAFSPPVNVCF